MKFYNMFSSDLKDSVCYKCNRCFLRDLQYKEYINPVLCLKNELVTTDVGFCPTLEHQPYEFELNQILLRQNELKREEQLLFVSYDFEIPLEIQKTFTFAGFDLICDEGSILMNWEKRYPKIETNQITQFGLIKNLKYAKIYVNKLTNLFKDSLNIDIVSIYRLTK